MRYLQPANKTLVSVLSHVRQIQQWNQWLRECLPDEDKLAEHCQLVSRSNRSLIAIADSAHWVTLFRFRIPTLLEKLRAYPGMQDLQAICCKVRPSHSHSSVKKKCGSQKKLSPKNAALMLEAAQKIKDEKLRAALEKIARNASF